MLRLLFCTAAILPIAIVPWVMGDDGTDAVAAQPGVVDATYAEQVRAPRIETLEECEAETLPVYFHDDMVTTHSVEFIAQGLDVASECGEVSATIIPVLPEFADSADKAESVERTAELREIMRQAGVDTTVSQQPLEPEAGALYLNGRAAILRIEPNTEVMGEVDMAEDAGDEMGTRQSP